MSKMKFEKALARLEEIVEELETGEVDIEKSLEIFEEGVKLTRFCSKKLEDAEKKIEILTKDEKNEFESQPFENKEGNS